MTIKAPDKVAARKMMSKSKPSDISIFRVNQTDSKSVTNALNSIKSEISKGKCDYEIMLVKK